MNLDMNAMSMLMQMLSQKNDGQKAQYEPPSAKNARPPAHDDNHIEKPAFALQNGIGEQIRLDFSPPEENRDVKNDFLKSLAGQNPMLSLLCNMQNADVASMLPLVMSLMQKPKASEQPKTDEKSDGKADGKCESNGNKSEQTNVRTSKNGNSNDSNTNNNQNAEKEKTQRDPFYPVAFAGYEAISSLYALIKASRRPCR